MIVGGLSERWEIELAVSACEAQVTQAGDGRWPKWAFEAGSEPDVRFSFANERCWRWSRRSLVLLAGGIALDALDLRLPDLLRRTLSALLVTRWPSTARAWPRGGGREEEPNARSVTRHGLRWDGRVANGARARERISCGWPPIGTGAT